MLTDPGNFHFIATSAIIQEVQIFFGVTWMCELLSMNE